MGQLKIPKNRKVYLDTSPVIYSVEKHTDYWRKIVPLWRLLKSGDIEIYTSELTLLEVLVSPIKLNNQKLISAYETLLTKTELSLLPVSLDVLRKSAEMRAAQNFKTPDAIHASTALSAGCDYFITNDAGFRKLTNINVVVLNDLL